MAADRLPNSKAWRGSHRHRFDREWDRHLDSLLRGAAGSPPLATVEMPELHIRLINVAHLAVAAAPAPSPPRRSPVPE